MQKTVFFPLFLLLTLSARPQTGNPVRRCIRTAIENDGINAWFKGTDWGYTSGIQMEYVYKPAPTTKKRRANDHFFSPACTADGWGLEQLMITPRKTRPAVPDKNDYPYAGALLASHTRYQAAPDRAVNFSQTWTAGLMGPASLAKQAQVLLHRLIGDPRPNGWDYQQPTDLLLNYKVTVEKKLLGKKQIQLIAGSTGEAGTFRNGITVFTVLRVEKGLSYFSGLHRQLLAAEPQKTGFAIQVKPAVSWTAYHALLDGGLFNKRSPIHDQNAISGTLLNRKRVQATLDLLLQWSLRQFSVSFTQKFFSPDFTGYEDHKVGNITLAFGW